MSEKDDSQATRLANIRKGIKKRSKEVSVPLPNWTNGKRGTPNSFLRSALFAAIQGKDRQFIKKAVLASPDGITLKFTGEQLNQSDLDVWEALIHLAREQHLGSSCHFTAYEILKTLGLPTGKNHYEYLHDTITRLTACAVEIQHEDYRYVGSLVNSAREKISERFYEVSFDKHMAKLFSENMWTAIDWEQRRQIREKPLVQALHSYYSSHREPFPLKLETLQAYTGSRNKDIHGFRQKIKAALKTLEDIGFLSGHKIDKGLVYVTRALLEVEKK